MKVRLTFDRVTNYAFQQAGEVIDLPEREAYRMIAADQAEAIEPESAATAAIETAVLDRPRFKGKR